VDGSVSAKDNPGWSMQLEEKNTETQGNRTAQVKRWDQTTKIIVVALLIILAGLAVYVFRIVFVPVIIGAILAYILTPLVKSICDNSRIPRGLATAIIYLVLLAVTLPLPASLIPWIVRQTTFLQGEMVDFIDYLDSISAHTVQIVGFELIVGDIVTEVTNAVSDAITSAAPASLSIVFNAAEILLLVIFTFLIAFYLTRDADKFSEWFQGLVPVSYREDMRRLTGEIDLIWTAFLRGQLILAVIVAALLTVISAALGLPQPVLLGVLGGMLEILPSVGHAIWLITVSVLALVEGSSTLPVSNLAFLLIVIGAHTAYTQFDLNFLIPHIIGRRVHLHPMVVIIGIITGAAAGSVIGGPIGSVLGVALAAPTIASLRVIGRYMYARLFDMDPFPMIGPPSAPSELREQTALQTEQAEEIRRPEPLGRLVERVRGSSDSRDGEPDVSAPPDMIPDRPREEKST
jgi:predicted PurR-regulated permease PerM